MKIRFTPASFAHAEKVLGELLRFEHPADAVLSRYFREHRQLGHGDRGFVADGVSARPRVIETTIREKLPPGFQRSEFLIEKGAIDMIVRRPEMRLKLASILAKLMNLPAPNPDEPREGVVVPDQEPEA